MEREKTRILIVDDEPQNTEIIQEILFLEGDYLIESVEDGYSALTIIHEFRPEIILLDVMMPGIDGYEVCRRIRNEESHRFVKIIMISGMSMVEERLKGYEAGADDYITKPFVEDELLAKIEVFSKLSRIEEVDLLKSTALYLMTHETRTPLNGILLGCEFLTEIEGLPDDALTYVNIIQQSGKRMHSLVSKINLLCQLKAGVEIVLSKKETDNELLKIVNEFSEQFQEQTFTFNSTGNFILNADWQLLKKSLGYVIDNACKFGKNKGTVDVFVKEEHGELIISIRDCGPGLNSETVNRIFEGFFAEDILHHDHGSGLSLSICRMIMIHHQGNLVCLNRKDGGAEFLFTFSAKSYSSI